MPRSSQRPNQI